MTMEAHIHQLSVHEEILIFSFLSLNDVGNLAQVCSRWKKMLYEDGNYVWQNLSNKLFGGDKPNKVNWRFALKSFKIGFSKTELKKRLAYAMRGGHVALVMKLWQEDPDISTLKTANVSLLIARAAAAKKPQVIKCLIDTGIIDEHPWKVLSTAVQQGNITLVEAIFSSFPTMQENINIDGKLSFSAAIKTDNPKMVISFIEKGAKLDNDLERANINAVHMAALNGKIESLKTMKELLPEKFIECGNESNYFRNAIGASIYLGEKSVDVISWLYENGIEFPAGFMCTAAGLGYIPLIEYLISVGQDVNTRDYDGNTPLHNARHIEAVKHLVAHGAD